MPLSFLRQKDYQPAQAPPREKTIVASVAERVAALEYPETCTLWWTDDTMKSGTSASAYNWIPTNFPTKTLKLVVYITNGTHVVSIPSTFTPDVSKKIVVIQYISGACTNYMRYGSTLIYNVSQSSGNSWMEFNMDWDPNAEAWTVSHNTLAGRPFSFAGGERFDPVLPNAPSTVEEWLEKHAQH